jgi:general secretion pathway protein H
VIAGPSIAPRLGTRRGSRRADAGFTLLEILIVMAIFAMVVGMGARGFRALAKSDLRQSSAQLSGAIRYLFDRASTTGKMHRLVLDLNDGKYWAEMSDDKFYVPREAESQQALRMREEKEADEDAEAKRKAEEKAKLEERTGASSTFDFSKLEMGDFKPKRARFAAFKEVALKPVELKKVKIYSVYTPRVTDPITAGRAYIYFFPLGQTEPAIVALSDMKDESFYSLVVHPITGRVQIKSELVNPPRTGDQYDDQGNRVVQ